MTGIDIHADFAAVNVNFWISPDEGNLDHNSGGLVVWDKAAPKDWSFKEYNEDEKKIQKFLQESNAEKIVVPHRQNRAMIFNSTLFHKTDDFEFNDNFENRRINVTFLYGQGLKT
jgi:small-conductance mechanosensitive channel